MKKILFILLFCTANTCFAFEYTDDDRDMFYDAFIEGYIQEMTNSINALNIDETKKHQFLKEFISQINRNDLINSSWNCIKNYPINEIVKASVVCTQDWSKQQTEKSKILFEKIK